MKPRIAIIHYNVGNLQNLKNALDYQNLPAEFVTRPEELSGFSHVILPGVGAFQTAMDHLRGQEMDQAVQEIVALGTPLLGVCVGMQVLFSASQENGRHQGLGIVPGQMVRFPDKPGLKVPHMGWNTVAFTRQDPLLEGIPDHSHFYFVHSYRGVLETPDDGLGLTDYDGLFPSIVRRGNVWGVQFHPEKSQNPGLALLANFSRIA
ncbi:MAG: imidazole glycerol phosphate synthase subunit HisH [Deltaproteobacteria bacterium]|nr:imidazole glycerol phosphate synthase subunit HisH [Deltaproteobacteria bacterium]